MTYQIHKIEIGDNVRMTEKYTFPNGFVLEKDRELTVIGVGARYSLPFVYVGELGRELQLQPRSYEKI